MNDKEKSSDKSASQQGTEEARRVVRTTVLGEMFSGPVPPPKMIEAFENVLSGSADRIFVMAEKEQHHQHKLDKLDKWLPFWQTVIGQGIGFVLAGGLIAVVFSCCIWIKMSLALHH